MIKNFPANAGDIREMQFRSLGQEDPRTPLHAFSRSHNPLQDYCLENPMDRGAWWATVHGVAKSWTPLSDFISLLNIIQSRTELTFFAQGAPGGILSLGVSPG